MWKVVALIVVLLVGRANAAQYNWNSTCSKWYFNPDNVRDPTIVYNNTSLPYGVCKGYDGTKYEFHPCNFAPNTSLAVCSDESGPKDACAERWTRIRLDQFSIPATAKQVILTGKSYITGPHQWTAAVYAWFRAPGSSWQLSPIFDGGYRSTVIVHAPVASINGVPTIEMAWRVVGAVLAPEPNADTAALNLILTGWCE